MSYQLTKRELELKRRGFGKHSHYWAYWAARMNEISSSGPKEDENCRANNRAHKYAQWIAKREGFAGHSAEIKDGGVLIHDTDGPMAGHTYVPIRCLQHGGYYARNDRIPVEYNGREVKLGAITALTLDNGRISGAEIIVGSHKRQHGAQPITTTVRKRDMLPEVAAELNLVFAA